MRQFDLIRGLTFFLWRSPMWFSVALELIRGLGPNMYSEKNTIELKNTKKLLSVGCVFCCPLGVFLSVSHIARLDFIQAAREAEQI